jgi:hypothetical protein
MTSKYLDKYRLCIDAFGDMPIWSLQHPQKEAEDAYMIKIVDYDQNLKLDKDLINELDRLAKIDALWFDVYITCEIQYIPGIVTEDIIEDYPIITKMKIFQIEIENGKEAGQP